MVNAPKDEAKTWPQRSFRCDDATWNKAKAKAADNDETLSQVIRQALRRYVNKR